jgi:hypothetical protein
MHIRRLFATIAEIPPGTVELITHQVVAPFHISIDKKIHKKNFLLDIPCASIQNKGTNAIKIRKVSGDTGHAIESSAPETRLSKNGWIFFNSNVIYEPSGVRRERN